MTTTAADRLPAGTPVPYLKDDAAAVLAAIRDDAADGAFRGDCISAFAELHDYLDANGYADCIAMDRAGRAMGAAMTAGTAPLGDCWHGYIGAVFAAVDAELHRSPVQ